GIGDDVHATEYARGLERQELRITGADADQIKPSRRLGHGLLTDHWVTGRRGRKARCVPRVSSTATSRRTSSPPRRDWRSSSAASASRVTALATKRPPERSAVQQAWNSASLATPPPRKTASGVGIPARLAGASPFSIRRVGAPRRSALTAIICRRSPSRS